MHLNPLNAERELDRKRDNHIVECRHPEHKPPTHLALPRGVFYTHTCPSCGARAGLTAPNVTLKGN